MDSCQYTEENKVHNNNVCFDDDDDLIKPQWEVLQHCHQKKSTAPNLLMPKPFSPWYPLQVLTLHPPRTTQPLHSIALIQNQKVQTCKSIPVLRLQRTLPEQEPPQLRAWKKPTKKIHHWTMLGRNCSTELLMLCQFMILESKKYDKTRSKETTCFGILLRKAISSPG